jgi:hypothetical protein
LYVVLDEKRTGLSGVPLLGLRLLATAVAAVASYRFIEMPVRDRRFGTVAPRIVGAGAAVAVVMTLLVAPSEPSLDAVAARQSGLPIAEEGDLKVMVVGDSTALAFGLRGRSGLPADIAVSVQASMGCSVSGPFLISNLQPAECREQFNRWTDAVNRFDPDVVLVMFGTWEMRDMQADEGLLKVGTDAFNNAKLKALDQALGVLSAKGAKVLLVNSPCHPDPDDGRYPADAGIAQWRVDNYNSLLEQTVKSHASTAQVVDLDGFLCPTGKFTGELNGQEFSVDGVHLNDYGAASTWEWLVPTLEAMRGQ